MKKLISKRVLGLLSLLIALPLWVCAQNITVKGTVTDASGDPLPGVNIMQKGSQRGVVTNIDGNYLISVPSNATLVASYVGFKTKEVSVNGQQTINIQLVEDTQTLSDVVVVGYGTMRKSDIAGSVVSVDREAMMKKVPTNIGQALQGSAAGVIVTQQDGAPDANSTVRIRGIGTINGSADPLYVVDGVQVGTNANFVNPADIESIEVLKDASATAIYGAAGANGVIMITTKHGAAGHVTVNITADFGISNLPYKLNSLSIDEFAQSVREAKANQGIGLYNVVWDAQYDGKRNYIDWQDQMTRSAFRQQYGLSVSGGSERSTYNFSVGYLDNNGIVVNTNMKRLTARANNITKVNKWLELGIDMNFVHSESSGSNAAFNNNGNLSSLRDFAYMTPTLDYVEGNVLGGKIINVNPVNSDGTFGTGYLNTADGWEGNTSNSANPYASQMENKGISKSNRLFASAYAQITFFPGLTLKSIGSYSSYAGEGNSFSGGRKRYNVINGNLTEIDVTNGGILDNRYDFSLNNNSSYGLGIETYLTYHFSNDVNNLTVMLGNSVSKSWGQWVNAGAKDFFSADNRNVGLTNDITTKTGGGAFNADVRGISYFARLTYSFKDRYILTATVRRDGSSNFGAGNRWGTFPSMAAAWRFSEEKFLKDQTVLSNGKLRIGWGQTGNAGNMTGKAIAALSTWETRYNFYNQGGTLGAFGGDRIMTSGFYAGLVDTDLKWETNEQTNIGLDLGFLNNSLNITADYFIRKSKDLLLNQQIRPSTGFSSVYTNYGEIQNKGFEFSVNYNKALNRDWTINVGVNGSTLKNKVVKMGDPHYSTNDGTTDDGSNVGAVGAPSGFHWGNHSICTEGEAVGSFYGYMTDGIIQNAADLAAYVNKFSHINPETGQMETFLDGTPDVGDFKYKDLNGDGVLDQNDMCILGNGIPKLNYGITIGATYKNWDFNLYGYGVAGQKILSYSAMRLSTVFSADDQTFPNILKDSWNQVAHVSNGQVTNPGATLPRLLMVDNNFNMRCSDAWVKNGDFFRLSTLQVGYTIDNEFIKKLDLTRVRLYASVQNLFTASKYNKYGDPEVGQGSVLFTGLDTGRFPMPRTWQFGLNVTF